jgi:hypothetical protein
MMAAPSAPTETRRNPRWHAWSAAGLCVAAAHLALLQGLVRWELPRHAQAGPTPATVARVLLAPPQAAPAEARATNAPAAPRTRAASPVAQAPARRPADTRRLPGFDPAPPAGVQTPPEVAARSAASEPAAPGPSGSSAEAEDDWPEVGALAGLPPPTYPAALPDAFVQRLAVQQNGQDGHGELRFERDADGTYRLRLSLRTRDRPLLEMSSRGRAGATGLAPERFTDQRRGRAARAANFDRVAGQVRFSTRDAAVATAPSAQDRLSWLVQLPGIVRSDEALRQPGARLRLQVVGARGASQIWQFERAPDAQTQSAGAPAWLHYVREPELPYDQRVEVWLDPARQYLPARARLTLVPSGQSLDIAVADAAEGT